MLRKILLSTVFVAATGTAFAADLPYRTAAPAPYAAAMPVFTWTGFYVGLNAGAAFNGHSSVSSTGFAAPQPYMYSGVNGGNDGRFTGGAQAGYNMQFGNFVAGVEADINYVQRKNGSSAVLPASLTPFSPGTNYAYYGVNQGRSSNYFGTVRGRLGFAVDRFLVFATGGLAYGARSGGGTVTEYNVNYVPASAGPPAVPASYNYAGSQVLTSNHSSSDIGYALGGGVEYAFSNAWSAKIEYMRVKLGSNGGATYATNAAYNPAGSTIVVHRDNKFDVGRAGVNYRF